MIFVKPGTDLISVNENNMQMNEKISRKIHLIKLDFEEPSVEKMDWVIRTYEYTKRFIVTNQIPFYNWYFKRNRKKFYVENGLGVGIFSFFKKNNKVFLNLEKLSMTEKAFILNDLILEDILKNLEIIKISQDDFNQKKSVFNNWAGNIVIGN